MKTLRCFIASMLLLAAGGALAEVNVNTATAAELAQGLKNVGPAKAAAIVEYRNMHGEFKSVDDLAEVHGIGESTLEMNRDVIILEDSKAKAETSKDFGDKSSEMADSKRLKD